MVAFNHKHSKTNKLQTYKIEEFKWSMKLNYKFNLEISKIFSKT